MRTRTIYSAMSGAYRTILFTQTVDDFLHRKARQWATFERELLRRMDERDAWAAERKNAETLYKAMNYPATPKPGMFVSVRW